MSLQNGQNCPLFKKNDHVKMIYSQS